MKTLKRTFLVMLVAGVGFTTVMLLTRSPRTLTTEANEVVAEPNVPSPEAEQIEPTFYQPPAAPAEPDAPIVEIAPPPVSSVRVRADQVLAKVNEQAILLRHLVPLQPDEQEQVMTAEEYESRLNRAIEMELTFQAAAARGVDLTPEQKQRVGGLAQKHEATLRAYQLQGITWSSVTGIQVEFEQRLTAALLLQQNLVAREVSVAPASDPALQARYEHSRREVLNRLKANSNVSVSTTEL